MRPWETRCTNNCGTDNRFPVQFNIWGLGLQFKKLGSQFLKMVNKVKASCRSHCWLEVKKVSSINKLAKWLFLKKTSFQRCLPIENCPSVAKVFFKHEWQFSFKFVAKSQQLWNWQPDWKFRFVTLGSSAFQAGNFLNDWRFHDKSRQRDYLCGYGCVCVVSPIITNWDPNCETSIGQRLHVRILCTKNWIGQPESWDSKK